MPLDAYAVCLRAIRAGRLLEGVLQEAAARQGFVVPGDYEVLATLRRSHPVARRPAELADATMVTSAGMTGRLDRLEASGHVERHPDPHDRRALAVRITAPGIAAVDAVFRDIVARETELLAPLPAGKRKSLAALLRELAMVLGDTP